MLRVVPAQQRLDGDGRLVLRRVERLVDHLELVARGERLAQLLLDGAAALHEDVHLFAEDAEAVAALDLGPVEGDIGLPHELCPLETRLRRHGDADGNSDERGVAEQLERLRHRGDDPLAERYRLVRVSHVVLQDGELVAAEPRHEVAVPHESRQPMAELADQVVACRVAERVVDVLEAVEVEVEERHAGVRAARFDQGPVEAIVEERAVGEARQRIVEGKVLGLRLARLELLRGAAQTLGEEGDDEAQDNQNAGERRTDLGQHPPARPIRLPHKVADHRSGISGERIGGLVGRDIAVPGKSGAVEQILAHQHLEEAAIEEAHADMKVLGAGFLHDLAGIGNDWRYAGHRRAGFDHDQIEDVRTALIVSQRARTQAFAKLLDQRFERGPRGRVTGRHRAGAVDHRIERLVLRAQDVDAIVPEVFVHPDTEVDVDPLQIEVHGRLQDRIIPKRHAFLVVA